MIDSLPAGFAIEQREKDELLHIAHLANLLMCPDTRPTVYMARVAAGSLRAEFHDQVRSLEVADLDPDDEIQRIYEIMWADIRERAAAGKEMVAGLVFRSRKLLAGLCTKYGDELWGPFGGKKESKDASSEAAVEREHDEELDGMEISVGECVGTYPTYSRGEKQLDVETFACQHEGGEPVIVETNNFADVQWLTLDDLSMLGKSNKLMPNMYPVLHGFTNSQADSHEVLHRYLKAS